jgi:hypothetical protein
MQVRTRNILHQDGGYQDFMNRYQEIIKDFQTTFEPYTNSTDY